MTAETQIKEALMSLFNGISSADSAVILTATEALDRLLAAHRTELHPQLRHFLEGRSYAKARMFLDGENGIPAGVCGGGAGKRIANPAGVKISANSEVGA